MTIKEKLRVSWRLHVHGMTNIWPARNSIRALLSLMCLRPVAEIISPQRWQLFCISRASVLAQLCLTSGRRICKLRADFQARRLSHGECRKPSILRKRKGVIVPPISYYSTSPMDSSACGTLDRLDLEVKGDKTKDQSFKVLHQVVKDSQSLRVGRLGHVNQRSNLGRLEIDMLAAEFDFQFLPSVFVLLWPLSVIFPTLLVSGPVFVSGCRSLGSGRYT